MRVAWVNPCFLHYRVPVYAALDRLLDGGLHVVCSAERTPADVRERLSAHLGDRVVALEGETRLRLGQGEEHFANVGISIPYQSGLARAIAACRADVIVSEGFFQWTPAALWVKKRTRTPMVIAYEKTPHTERNAPRLRTMYRRWVAAEAGAIACNGSLSKQYCTTVLGVAAERVVTGAMAADSEALAAKVAAISRAEIDAMRARLCEDDSRGPLFLYVGRLIRLKGLQEMLAAWEKHTASGGAGSLVLVGEGPEHKALDAVVRDRKLPRVTFAGKANYADIAGFYAAADVLVMPTLEDNWSLVVPEAMACGKPILCSKFNGCWPELVHGDVNGWVFDPGSSSELAALFGKCVAESNRLPAMGEASRRIVADFTPAHAAQAVRKACEIAFDQRVRRAAS